MIASRLSAINKLVLTSVLLLGQVVHAEMHCTDRTITGTYAFQINGRNTAVGLDYSMVGRLRADGNGRFKGAGTQSVGGRISNVTFVGEYTTNVDCWGTGTFRFTDGITVHCTFELAANGDEIFIIDSDQGTVETGTARRKSLRQPK
jgi:hypothetical protein